MINPTEKDIGKKVVYKKYTPRQEYGYITSYNDNFVFVNYNEKRLIGYSQATNREDLEWV